MLRFREFLLEFEELNPVGYLKPLESNNLRDYIINGTLYLYHFSKANEPELTTDIERFGQNYFTRRDKQVSDVKRTFFYLDLRDKEQDLIGKNLFKTRVTANTVYDLITDPEGIKEHFRLSSGTVDIHSLLGFIKNKYAGIYSKPGGMHVVNYFIPLPLKQVDEKQELSKFRNKNDISVDK